MVHGRILHLRHLNLWQWVSGFIMYFEGILREESGLLYSNDFFFSIFIWYLLFHLAVLNGKNMLLFITAVHPSIS